MSKISNRTVFHKISRGTIAALLLIVVAFLAINLISGDIRTFIPFSQKNTDAKITAPVTTFAAVSEAGPQAYPIIDGTQVVWVSLDNPSEKSTLNSKQVGVFTDINLGRSGALPAPDLRKVAIVENHNQLVIASSDGSSIYRLPDLRVNRLIAWAPNSQKLIVHVQSQTVKSAFYPYGVMELPDPSNTTFDLAAGARPGGYYFLDLEKKSSMHLPMLDDVEVKEFIDDTHLLLSIEDPHTGSNEHFASFDLMTYKVDGTKLFNIFTDLDASQFSFSRDGKLWTITISAKEGSVPDKERMWVAVGKYPNFPNTVIQKGEYAQNQASLISPDGSKVLFRSRDIQNGPEFIQLYNKNTVTRLVEGRTHAEMWIDSDRFIYVTYAPTGLDKPAETATYHVYNTETGESTKLFEAKISNK